MKLFDRNFVMAAVIGFSGAMAHAQTTTQGSMAPKRKGISFALPSGGGATVGGSLELESKNELRLDLGLDMSKPSGGDMTFGFSIDAGLRSYISEAANVKIYAQPGLFLAKAAGTPFMDALTIAPTFGLGGEYAVSKNFTFGAQVGAALSFSQKFKAFSLKTGTSAVRATYYW